METRDWITLVAALIVVIGWFVNGFLNRQHEKAKKRMDYRLEALQSFLPIFFDLTDEKKKNIPNLNERFSKARTSFHLYGTRQEIICFEKLVHAAEIRDDDAYTEALREFIRLVREGIRTELGLEIISDHEYKSFRSQ